MRYHTGVIGRIIFYHLVIFAVIAACCKIVVVAHAGLIAGASQVTACLSRVMPYIVAANAERTPLPAAQAGPGTYLDTIFALIVFAIACPAASCRRLAHTLAALRTAAGVRPVHYGAWAGAPVQKLA